MLLSSMSQTMNSLRKGPQLCSVQISAQLAVTVKQITNNRAIQRRVILCQLNLVSFWGGKKNKYHQIVWVKKVSEISHRCPARSVSLGSQQYWGLSSWVLAGCVCSGSQLLPAPGRAAKRPSSPAGGTPESCLFCLQSLTKPSDLCCTFWFWWMHVPWGKPFH